MTVASGRVAVASAMVVRTTLLVGSQGDSHYNALAEANNGFYKAKLIHHKASWKTMDSLELATIAWGSWFKHHRLLEPIRYIAPVEAEENYYR